MPGQCPVQMCIRDRCPVALRKESVDRNSLCGPGARQLQNVALRKESVDRNLLRWVHMLSLIHISNKIDKDTAGISIHARLAESDSANALPITSPITFLSTLSLRLSLIHISSALPKCSIRHPVLSALLAWHLPHLARRIGT